MLLVVAAAVPCGWLRWKMIIKHKERAAVAEIERLGGLVGYDWKPIYVSTVGKPFSPPQPPGPAWLRSILGDDFFASVVEVSVNNGMTDDGFVRFGTFANAEELWLGQTRVSNVDLEQLKGMSHLRKLDLSCTGITDDGLEYLQYLSCLRELTLTETQITDTGVAYLARLRGLTKLSLNITRISDEGLVYLADLTTLEELKVSSTYVSDAGLTHLRALANLKALTVGNYVTDAGVAELQKALPNCEIIR